MSDFIFMLTQNDVTRPDALAAYEEVRGIDGLRYVGFKDIGLDLDSCRVLVDEIHSDGRSVFFEVVSDSATGALDSSRSALRLGVDYLIGTFPQFASATLAELRNESLKFMPYAGSVYGHPCVLTGTIAEICDSARRLEEDGAAGIDLLAYRHASIDGDDLVSALAGCVTVPLVIAGGIRSANQIEQMNKRDVWAFTVGSAVFESEFAAGGSVRANVDEIVRLSETRAEGAATHGRGEVHV